MLVAGDVTNTYAVLGQTKLGQYTWFNAPKSVPAERWIVKSLCAWIDDTNGVMKPCYLFEFNIRNIGDKNHSHSLGSALSGFKRMRAQCPIVPFETDQGVQISCKADTAGDTMYMSLVYEVVPNP